MKKRSVSAFITTFILCYLFWLLLTMSLKKEELLGGLLISAVTAWFSSGFLVQNEKSFFQRFNILRFFKLIGYILFCLIPEILKANINMAKIVITGTPLKQCIIKIPIHGITDFYGLALLADSITLTPGTITTDVSWENGEYYMYVQWLIMETDDPEEAGRIIKGRMEHYIGGIFG